LCVQRRYELITKPSNPSPPKIRIGASGGKPSVTENTRLLGASVAVANKDGSDLSAESGATRGTSGGYVNVGNTELSPGKALF
jgi:hypothetical protein